MEKKQAIAITVCIGCPRIGPEGRKTPLKMYRLLSKTAPRDMRVKQDGCAGGIACASPFVVKVVTEKETFTFNSISLDDAEMLVKFASNAARSKIPPSLRAKLAKV
jgi:hypothetical protein